jgi:hypothetical protein
MVPNLIYHRQNLIELNVYMSVSIGGIEVKLQTFITSAIDRGDWSASNPNRFIPGERKPVTP